MITLMLTVLFAWLLLSALTAVGCCLLLRGGQMADRVPAPPPWR
jgi:hypothetical protein